jgi:hypothetical protein
MLYGGGENGVADVAMAEGMLMATCNKGEANRHPVLQGYTLNI